VGVFANLPHQENPWVNFSHRASINPKHPDVYATAATRHDRPIPGFRGDKLFFSTTDTRGVITWATRSSSGSVATVRPNLLGHAHNVIRHPDMPQAAFRLVWSRLKARQPVAALVKNRAQDGRYYWVVALITPDTAGYLSVRFKPAGKFLPLAEALYARMLAAEHEARDRGADLAAIMDSGAASADRAHPPTAFLLTRRPCG